MSTGVYPKMDWIVFIFADKMTNTIRPHFFRKLSISFRQPINSINHLLCHNSALPII